MTTPDRGPDPAPVTDRAGWWAKNPVVKVIGLTAAVATAIGALWSPALSTWQAWENRPHDDLRASITPMEWRQPPLPKAIRVVITNQGNRDATIEWVSLGVWSPLWIETGHGPSRGAWVFNNVKRLSPPPIETTIIAGRAIPFDLLLPDPSFVDDPRARIEEVPLAFGASVLDSHGVQFQATYKIGVIAGASPPDHSWRSLNVEILQDATLLTSRSDPQPVRRK
jgi:hypothetical protein